MPDPFLFDPVKVLITVLVALIPPIIYAILIRYSEKYEREPWGSIGQAMLWGGTLCIVIVIMFRGFFRLYIEDNYPNIATEEQYLSLIILCIITPIIAEIIKPIGLLFVKVDLNEAEDGLIYGVVIGLGYTATENLLYGIFLAPLYGIGTFIMVVIVRSVSVMFIHSSTTALSCYGITRAMKVKHKKGSMWLAPLFLLASIGIHSAFNYIVFMDLFNIGKVDILFSISTGLLFSIIFAFILFFLIYFKIYRLDRIDEAEEKEKEVEKARLAAGGSQPGIDVRRRVPERDDYYARPPPRHGPPAGQFMPLYQPPASGRPPPVLPQRRPRPPGAQRTPQQIPYPAHQRPPRTTRAPRAPRPTRPPRPPLRKAPTQEDISKRTPARTPPKIVEKAYEKEEVEIEEESEEEFEVEEEEEEKKEVDVDWDM